MLGTTAVSGEFPEIYSIIKKKHCIWCYSNTLNLFKIVKKKGGCLVRVLSQWRPTKTKSSANGELCFMSLKIILWALI